MDCGSGSSWSYSLTFWFIISLYSVINIIRIYYEREGGIENSVPRITCWERADLLAVVFVGFCHFPKFVLVHIRIKGEVGAIKLVKALQ